MRIHIKGLTTGGLKGKGVIIFISLLLMVLGWFSIALAGNLRNPRSNRFVDYPIQARLIADYSVDPEGIEIPVIDIRIIAEISSKEILTQIQEELIIPVPLAPEYIDVLPSVSLSITPDMTVISEAGGLVNFTVKLTNLVAEKITLNNLVDGRFGDLGAMGCAVNVGIAAHSTYTCSFSGMIEGNAGDTISNTVTASGGDDDGNVFSKEAHSSVAITDSIPSLAMSKTTGSPSVPEPGSDVVFDIKITNTSDEPVTLVRLVDNNSGDLDDQGDCNSMANPYPENLGIGEVYSCSFSAPVTGNAGDVITNTATASIQDDESNLVTGADSTSVIITDVLPSFSLTKSASTGFVNEPSGSVSYTISVKNTSVEGVYLISLVDDKFGSLAGKGNCSTGGSIAVGATYTCSFTKTLDGNAGDSHSNTITATIADDEGNSAVDTASATVNFLNIDPTVLLTNTASVDLVNEPGGDVTFTIQVTNTSLEDTALLSLVDNHIGNLPGIGTCDTLANPFPADLPPGSNYQCQFSLTVSGDGGDSYNSEVTVTITDDEGNLVVGSDDALVSIKDVLPTIIVANQVSVASVDEPGGDVTYSVQVENTSPETLTLTSLTDTKFGDLTAKGCPLGTISIGATYSCDFTGTVNGDAGEVFINTITAIAWDNDANSTADSDNAKVEIADVLPSITVSNLADVASVDEPGGDVTYTVQVENTSPESVTLSSLISDTFGSLDGQGNCAVSGGIPTGGSYTCSFSRSISGDGGDTHTSTVTAVVKDNENNTGTESAAASVGISDVLPTITVNNQAGVDSIDEPDESVTYTIQVQNTSPESVKLSALTSDVFGNLDAQGSCLVGGSIPIGGSYTCSFIGSISGNAGDTHTNIVTASVKDNENNTGTANVPASVGILDVLPTITVNNQVGVPAMDEPGGDVTYTVQVQNTSPESVTLTSLTDTQFGDLTVKGCGLVAIASGVTYSCEFAGTVSGDAGDIFTNTITAIAGDDDGNSAAVSDNAEVAITDVLPSISVSNQAGLASMDEPGGDVVYTIQVQNTSPEILSLISLTDTRFGDLTAKGCLLGPIDKGATYSCDFTGTVSGDAGENFSNTVSVVVGDNEGNSVAKSDTETIAIVDVMPTLTITNQASAASVDEPGGDLTYAIQVNNTSPEPAILSILSSDVFGSLDGQGTCAVGGSVSIGGSYTCSFTHSISGNGGDTYTNIVTASVKDNEINSNTADDAASVGILDVLPTIIVNKSAGVDSLKAPGGGVTFFVVVTNTSQEIVTLTSLSDDRFGDLNGQGLCVLPQDIVPGGTYSCSFSGMVSGISGDVHTNIVTASAEDDELNNVVASDNATVTITDQDIPTINITKTPVSSTIPEPGGLVTYTIQIENTFNKDVELINLIDDTFGDLDGQGTCSVPQTILDGGNYICSFSGSISGSTGFVHTNTVTAEVTESGVTGRTSDDAMVTITDVLPSLLATISSGESEVVEPGEFVSFSIEIENTSVEEVTLTSLIDDKFGDLHGQGSCGVNNTIIIGGTYSCTFDGYVSGSAGDTHTNTVTAQIQDDEGNLETDSASSAVDVILPTSVDVSGQVRNDTDFDGDLADPDAGISGVTVQLSDGACVIGFTCPSTTTNFAGYYTFSGIFPGDFVLLETDLLGFVSTADSQGANDNRIELTVSSGIDLTDNDFLDTDQTASIRGQVRDDRDGDGDLGDNDSGLEGLTIELREGYCVLGVDCRSAITDNDGYYEFENVIAGDYFVVENDLPDYFSTADSDPPNDNRIRVTLITGVDSNDNDFLDTIISSTCSAPDPVEGFVTSTNPAAGEVISLSTTTIEVVFNQAMATSGGGSVLDKANYDGKIKNLTYGGDVEILSVSYHSPTKTATLILDTNDSDWLPGSEYQLKIKDSIKNACESDQGTEMLVSFFTRSGIAGQVRNDIDVDGNLGDGDPGIYGVTVELVQAGCSLGSCPTTASDVNGYYLFADLGAGNYTLHEHDLSGYTSTADADGINDNQIEVTVGEHDYLTERDFLDTSSSCTAPDPVDGFVSSTNPAVGEVISLSVNTIEVVYNQAMATSGGGSVLDRANYDDKIKNLTYGGDVEILSVSYHAPTKTATLILDTNDLDWLPGSEYQLKIKDSIKNACESVQGTEMLVSFFTRSGIAGQVRNDVDVDGDLGDGDQGIPGVTIELVQAGCSLGSCPTTASDGKGYYLFADLGAGNYTLHEYDLSGYTSTADVDGNNDNQIEVTVGGHDYITGRDFLDTSSCSPPDPVDGFVSSTNPADGSSLISMTTSKITIQFNQPMATEGGGSVLILGNYHDKLKNIDLGGDMHFSGVDYDSNNYIVTLFLDNSDSDWQPGSSYELKIDKSIENACKVSQVEDVISVFQTTSAISGQVRKDEDGDGNLSDADPGLANISLELRDGICTSGVNCRLTTTNGIGFYIFTDVVPGNYSLVEYNLAGYTSTADTSGANDDTISVTLAAGPLSTNNDFLDTHLPLIEVSASANPSTVDEGTNNINFAVTVENISVKDATLISLTDDVFGSLDGQGSCAVGVLVPSGNNYSCSFTRTISGNAGDTQTNMISASVKDSGGAVASDSDSSSVSFSDVLPILSILSTPDITEVDPTGQAVLFTVQVVNLSPENVTLIKLDNDKFGNLDGQGTCALPQTINYGGTYTCTYPGVVSGNVGDVKTSETEAEIQDDEENKTKERVATSINVVDILPTITVTIIPSANTIDPLTEVTFEIQVTNTSPEDVTLESLLDDIYGDLNGQGSCDLSTLPVIPAFGGIYSCNFTESISGSHGEIHINQVTVQVSDDEGNLVSEYASATVNIVDSPPSFNLSLVPDPAELDEPGGDVAYTVTIENTSPEAIIIVSLIDDIFGDLSGDCSVGGSVAVGETYACAFTRAVIGVGGDSIINTLTVNVQDDDGNIVLDMVSASVMIRDVLLPP